MKHVIATLKGSKQPRIATAKVCIVTETGEMGNKTLVLAQSNKKAKLSVYVTTVLATGDDLIFVVKANILIPI
ncbi:MAG: hypothetical protein S4CHLAM6_02060 [Chlamydiae bacterium]|nr:hypothetical protein [Chlamydiota bacterium]